MPTLTERTDRINIHTWAETKVTEYTATVRAYINDGLSVETALEIVLGSSTLSATYKQRVKDAVTTQ